MKSTRSLPSAHVLKKSQPEDYDLVILGGGTGSTVAAWTFASEGKSVAVIDRKYIGGSCPNIACLPSKNIIHSAKVASYIRRSKEFGIALDGFAIDMTGVRERKRKMVTGLNEMYLENYRNTGAEFILGLGRFIAPKTVEVALPDGNSRQLRGINVIISTGTRARLEAIPGLAEAEPLTHIEALELDRVPEHLLVIGAGYVGIELSQAMRRFGTKVTVIDRTQHLMSKEDEDVSEALRALLRDEDIDIVLGTRVKRVEGKSGDAVSVILDQDGTQEGQTRQSRVGGDRTRPKYRGPRIGTGWSRINGGRIHPSQRETADYCTRRMGNRRSCRQPPVYTYQHGRLSRRSFELNRR